MRPRFRTALGLVAAALLACPAAHAQQTPDGAALPLKAPKHAGDGPGYRALGELPVLHVENMGSRIKPLDTYARQLVKDVVGRDAIKLVDVEGDTVQTWTGLAAFTDWPVRPTFWDGQEIILLDMFDYRTLKETLLAHPIRRALEAVADHPTTTAEDRAILAKVLKSETVGERDLAEILRQTKLAEADRATVKGWAAKLAEGRKWAAPQDLDDAILVEDGQELALIDWYSTVSARSMQASESRQPVELTPFQEKLREIVQRLIIYQTFRDRNPREIPSLDILVVPRPYGPEYLAFTGALTRKLAEVVSDREKADQLQLGLMETDAFAVLKAYLEDLKSIGGYFGDIAEGKQKPPGEDPRFDRNFAKWLRDKSAWVPLRVVLNEKIATLERAGFPRAEVEAFRSAFERLQSAEASAPGALAETPAAAYVAAARALGTANNAVIYPPADEMALETHFNRFAPFVKAPMAYGTALVLLLISLGITADRRTTLGKVDLLLYLGGMLAFVAGLALEVYGFYLRVSISGWAPVTNMYETVIWVAAVAAVLGLVLELIFRKKYAIVAASGMALLGTVLAANVPLLDGDIRQLTPVLRDNYWLTVHVLTIVSSYAAFTLALGLGLLAVGFYLSATYRRDVNYFEAAAPMVVGVPLALVGGFGWWAINQGWISQGLLESTPVKALPIALTMIGWGIGAAGLGALAGEFANRKAKSAMSLGLAAMAAGALGVIYTAPMSRPSFWPNELPLTFVPGLVAVGGFAVAAISLLGGQSRRVLRKATARTAAGGEASEAPLARSGSGRPSVEEIRSLAAASRPTLDPRSQAMQHVAGQVKPMANFLYRAMQVGVLLVAAGTILGGVWADVSWGRFWGWDAKEVWALITLLVYLVPLHGRFAGWVSTFGLVVASVVCYMSVLMAWYGVNFVLGVGLHSYGFTEGGGQYLVITCAVGMIGVALGSAWRRWLGSRTLA